MLLRKSSQILADYPKSTRIVTIREPLVAVSTGCQKPLETLRRILQKIIGHSGFQKPVDMGTCGFRKLYCDCTSGFLCPLNQLESSLRKIVGHSGFQKPVDMGTCGFRNLYCDCTSGFLCPLNQWESSLRKIVGHSCFQKPVDMSTCGFQKLYCDCISGFLCTFNKWESSLRTLQTRGKIGTLRTNFCRSCLKQFLFKTKNYKRNPKQSWFNHKNPIWYPISGETLPVTSTEA
jgi:hypothetical protein